MAWGNHETVDRFHGALVLAERELNRRGASGVVALARERHPLVLRNARYVDDARPVDARCDCYTCRHFSRGYLRHLLMAREPLAVTLNTMHNVTHYQTLMRDMRAAITAGSFGRFAASVIGEEAQPCPA